MDALAFTLQHSRRAVSPQQTVNQRATLMTALRLRSGELCRSCGGLPRGESTLQGSGV
jgi:hypothetical protein